MMNSHSKTRLVAPKAGSHGSQPATGVSTFHKWNAPKIRRKRSPSVNREAEWWQREIIATLGGCLSSKKACCPVHADSDPSLSVNVVNGKLLVKCHAECPQDAVISELIRLKIWPYRLVDQTVYDYTDQSGNLLYQVVRKDLANGEKEIWQRRPGGGTLKGVPRVPYRLPDVLRATNVPVHIVEGEKCVEALRELNVTATCNSGGAGKWPKEFAPFFKGKDVVVHEDNDEPGRKHAEAVCRSLQGIARSIKLVSYRSQAKGYDVADWIRDRGTATKLRERLKTTPEWNTANCEPTCQAGSVGNVVWMDKVKIEKVKWLWKGRIPFGKLTLLDGDPGVGKSTVTVEIAARLSCGEPITPDRGSARCEPMRTLFITSEDDAGDTIKPRLEAAGANHAMVACLSYVPDATNHERPISLPEDIPLLERTIVEHRIRLVVIDPLMAHLNGSVDSHKDQHIRAALTPLAQLAQRTGVAFVIVRHLNKSQGGSAVYRGGGSIGIAGAARSVLLLAKDPQDENYRILAVSKCNLSKLPPSRRFQLQAESPDGPAHVKWCGFSDYSANQLLEPQTDRSPALQVATVFLKTQLADGPKRSDEILKAADAAGISERTVARARKTLGVNRHRNGTHWFMSLPEKK